VVVCAMGGVCDVGKKKRCGGDGGLRMGQEWRRARETWGIAGQGPRGCEHTGGARKEKTIGEIGGGSWRGEGEGIT